MIGRCVLDGASGVSDSHVAIVVKVAGSMIATFASLALSELRRHSVHACRLADVKDRDGP